MQYQGLMIPENIKAVLFDLDGTLFNSMGILKESYFSFLKSKSKLGSEEEFESLTGAKLVDVVSILKDAHQLEGDVNSLFEEYSEILDSNYLNCQALPDADELLRYLGRKNKRLALVTSASSNLVQPVLERLGWKKFFQCVVTGDSVEHTKPHPALYRKALEKIGIEAHEAVAIEDSANGVKSATSASICTLAISDELTKMENLAGASYILSGLRSLKLFLDKRFFHSPFIQQFEPISSEFSVKVDTRKEVTIDKVEQRVDEIWSKALVENKQLFDGQILSFELLRENTLRCKQVSYRYFYSQLIDSALKMDLQVKVVAVSGICRYKDKVLLGRRRESCTQFPNWYELVPSGSLDFDKSNLEGVVDFKSQILEELAEEAGLNKKMVKKVTPFGLFFDQLVVEFCH